MKTVYFVINDYINVFNINTVFYFSKKLTNFNINVIRNTYEYSKKFISISMKRKTQNKKKLKLIGKKHVL